MLIRNAARVNVNRAILYLTIMLSFVLFGITTFISPNVSAQASNEQCGSYSGLVKSKCETLYRNCQSSGGNADALLRCTNTAKSISERINDQCNIRTNKAACQRDAITCNTLACINAKLRKYPLVNSQCRTAQNPQSCNTQIRNCGSVPRVDRQQCISEAREAGGTSAQAAAEENKKLLDAEREVNGKCGEGKNAIETSIDFGCTGKGNPIVDISYAIIRFLSFGVGLVIAASIIYAGIQYSASSGNPENSQNAKNRIINSLVGLVFYLLIFAFIQFLVPGGLFNSP